MTKKCLNCRLVNFADAETCSRCETSAFEIVSRRAAPRPVWLTIARRAVVCIAVVAFTIAGFYISLIGSAQRLGYEQKKTVERAIGVLDANGFRQEVFFLNYLTAYRATDNWLNQSIEKENAYAATNFPFEIMTIYEDFYKIPLDDTERAAILLHESRHLLGDDEPEAYGFVWRNRHRIGWTHDKYSGSILWRNVRKQTRELVPSLFTCPDREYSDCTEEKGGNR